MIKILKYGEVKNEEIFARAVPAVNVESVVADIINTVRAQGDRALFAYTEKFDGKCPQQFEVDADTISDALEADEDGGGLSMMDVLAQEDDMAERIGSEELCRSVGALVDSVLSEREAKIIRLRYGLGGGHAHTQKETAELCRISRSYVSRIEKKALEKLRAALGDAR
mgnify:CR=1 FL=1